MFDSADRDPDLCGRRVMGKPFGGNNHTQRQMQSCLHSRRKL
jgi:hypothetical protein